MHYLYILKSKVSDKYYIGETTNIENRIERHKEGKTAFGKRNKDLVLVYKEGYITRGEAKKVEYFLKRQESHKFIDKLIAGKIDLPR